MILFVLTSILADRQPKTPSRDILPPNIQYDEPTTTETVKPSTTLRIQTKSTTENVHKPNKDAIIKTSSRSADQQGNYQYQFESSNGISSNEGGVAGQFAQGSTTWIARSGEPLAISWIADKDGYRAEGIHHYLTDISIIYF